MAVVRIIGPPWVGPRPVDTGTLLEVTPERAAYLIAAGAAEAAPTSPALPPEGEGSHSPSPSGRGGGGEGPGAAEPMEADSNAAPAASAEPVSDQVPRAPRGARKRG